MFTGKRWPLALLFLAVFACKSSGGQARTKAALSDLPPGINIAFVDDDKLLVRGVGTSDPRYKTPVQHLAVAKEMARINAQQEIRNLCDRQMRDPVLPNIQTDLYRSPLHGAVSKVQKSSCAPDAENAQFTRCEIRMTVSEQGLMKRCRESRGDETEVALPDLRSF